MMKANEARTLTEKAIELEITTRKARAEEFCENLTERITDVAKSRHNQLTIEEIPNGLYSYVIGILKDNGYTVTQLNNRTLSICW